MIEARGVGEKLTMYLIRTVCEVHSKWFLMVTKVAKKQVKYFFRRDEG